MIIMQQVYLKLREIQAYKFILEKKKKIGSLANNLLSIALSLDTHWKLMGCPNRNSYEWRMESVLWENGT